MAECCSRCEGISDEALAAARAMDVAKVRVGPILIDARGAIEPAELGRAVAGACDGPTWPLQRLFLRRLAFAYPGPVACAELMTEWYGVVDKPARHNVRVAATRLRATLRPWGVALVVELGFGYRLVVEENGCQRP